MTTMAKMAISICVLALGLYAGWFVRIGELTLREHLVRIADTPEAHDLTEGIATAVGSAKMEVKSRVASRLQAARTASAEESEEAPEEP